jgi:hypothetical protein
MNHNFIKWGNSLSGCDGGNPEARIWFSGIEWGFGKLRKESISEHESKLYNFYKYTLPEEIANGEYIPNSLYDWKESLKYPFGITLAKIYSFLHGKPIGNYQAFVSNLMGTEILKLNLYPIAFKSTEPHYWEKYELNKVTGISSKELYRLWCFQNRFPAISKIVKEKNPKAIICFGLGYLYDYFLCYSGISHSSQVNEEILFENEKNQRRFYWSKIEKSNTLLFVLPFPSSQLGLNSDILLETVSDKIRHLINDSDA